jgi:hypothetical protein
MKRSFILILTLLIPFLGNSQEDEKKIKLKVNGFVKNDFFWDSRQTITAREGQFLLFPAAVSEDADGNDINAVPNLNFLAVQSRVSLGITGPDVLNAKVSAKIEGDFFAQANDNINLLRLRHAYINMKWENAELLFGQYWIPMFVTGCFPGTVSFNTGTPFQPFGRSPQVRFTYNFGPAKFIAIAHTQRDFQSAGPGGATSSYLRNSSMPEFSAQFHFGDGKNFLAGFGGGFKQIVPEFKTDSSYSSNERVSSFSSIAFLKVKTSPITFKLEGIYGQNMRDVLSIGGIARTELLDPARDIYAYSPLTTMSGWIDIQTNGEKFQFGIFGGYSQNLGTVDDINNEIIEGDADFLFGLGTSIQSIYRVSPRIVFNAKPVRLAFETEYTVAQYGSAIDNNGIPDDLTQADNLRFLFAVYYFF